MNTSKDMQLRVPFATLLRIALFGLLVYTVIKLSSFLLMMFLAILLAVVLDAATTWLEHHRVRRGLALIFTSGMMFLAFLLFLFIVLPDMVSELQKLIKDAPRISARVSRSMPGLAPYLQTFTRYLQQKPDPHNVREWMNTGAVAGSYILNGLTAVAMILVTAVYLVIEGKRAFAWLVSFAPDRERKKLVQTGEEVRPVMLAYMRGQLITSSLSGLTALAVLWPLNVPAALGLAVLSFVGDFVPVVGFIISLIPAVLLAMLKGPKEAFIVTAVYFGYQIVENYIISPMVYGKAMRISTLTVLLTIVVGGILLGPIGAIILLPVAAAYPAIERIWLQKHLPAETIERHDAIESDDDAESEQATKDALRT